MVLFAGAFLTLFPYSSTCFSMDPDARLTASRRTTSGQLSANGAGTASRYVFINMSTIAERLHRSASLHYWDTDIPDLEQSGNTNRLVRYPTDRYRMLDRRQLRRNVPQAAIAQLGCVHIKQTGEYVTFGRRLPPLTTTACALSTASPTRSQRSNPGRCSRYVRDPGYLCPDNALKPSRRPVAQQQPASVADCCPNEGERIRTVVAG